MMTWPGPQLLSWKKGMIRKAELELRGKWDEGLRNFLERRRSYLEEEVGSREGLT